MDPRVVLCSVPRCSYGSFLLPLLLDFGKARRAYWSRTPILSDTCLLILGTVDIASFSFQVPSLFICKFATEQTLVVSLCSVCLHHVPEVINERLSYLSGSNFSEYSVDLSSVFPSDPEDADPESHRVPDRSTVPPSHRPTVPPREIFSMSSCRLPSLLLASRIRGWKQLASVCIAAASGRVPPAGGVPSKTPSP
jgi:hypothetical protein